MKLSIVFSFYNEEDNIPELLKRTRQVLTETIGLAKGEYEIIFVNDRSTDRSEQMIRDEMAAVGDIKLLNTSRTFGNAACILAGFAFAKGEYIGYLDSDLQDPPELFAKLYSVAKTEGVDIVHTRRTRRHGESAVKLLVTRLGYRILGYSMSVPLQPNVGDFKLLSRRVVDAVLKLNEPLPFIRGMISYVGFRASTVEYEREARFGGETHFQIFGRRVISNFINNALVSYSDLPLHVIIYLSLLGMLLAAGLVAYALFIKFTGQAVPGSAGVLVTITTFSSLILFGIGVLGLYMSSIKKAVLNRPNYIIESVHEAPFLDDLKAAREKSGNSVV